MLKNYNYNKPMQLKRKTKEFPQFSLDFSMFRWSIKLYSIGFILNEHFLFYMIIKKLLIDDQFYHFAIYSY